MSIKTGPMDGPELVAHTRWARQRSGVAGANEVGICANCHQPFLFNGHVVMPRTCGRERCMEAVGEVVDLRVLYEPSPATPPTSPRTRRAGRTSPPTDVAPEPICRCACHLNAYQRDAGFVSEPTQDTCEHCCV